jgi:hypothetical protein
MWSNHSGQQGIENDNQTESAKSVASPRFDEEAVRQAKPVVPLSQIIAKRYKPITLITVAVFAGLLGVLIGSLVPVEHQNARTTSKTSTAQSPSVKPQGDLQTEKGKTVSKSANTQPDLLPANQPNQQVTGNPEEEVYNQPENATPDSPESANQLAEHKQELLYAFNTWLKAQKTGNVEGQMGFYPPTVTAFYRWRGVAKENVRAEKSRVFGRANVIHIESGEPEIKMSLDGQQATIRFRKQYRIESSDGDRNGEVLQELRWQRRDSKWQIISERDMKVLQ